MDYHKFGQTIILRLDRGEEILEQLKAVGQAEGIKLASINGLGAVGDFTVGVFDPEKSSISPTSSRAFTKLSPCTEPSAPSTGNTIPTCT